MRRTVRLLAAALGAAPLAAPTAAHAQPQEGDLVLAFLQTFTAPAAGGPLYLQSLRALGITTVDGGRARVFAWSGGAPVGSFLFSQGFPGQGTSGPPLDLEVLPALLVTPGQQYVLQLELGRRWSVPVDSADAYPGGQLYRCSGAFNQTPADCPAQPGQDLRGFAAAFGTTPTSTVPEPATAALTAAGALAVGAAARRRRR